MPVACPLRPRPLVSGSRQPEDQHYYHEVVEALAGAQEVLIVGPGHAKLELIKHIHAHDHEVVNKVVGVETLDDAGLSPAALLAIAHSLWMS